MPGVKRPLKSHKVGGITAQLKELQRLREKSGYKKISDHKRQKVRGRIRWHLGVIRRMLPKVEGITNPCDPESWDIIEPSEKERQAAVALFATMSKLFGSRKW